MFAGKISESTNVSDDDYDSDHEIWMKPLFERLLATNKDVVVMTFIMLFIFN